VAAGRIASGTRPALGYPLIFAAVSLWAVNAAVSKVVIDSAGLSSQRLTEVRIGGAALVLVAGVALARPRSLRIRPRELGFLAVFGVAGLALVQFFYFVSIERIAIGPALVIEYVTPLLVGLWARFVVREPVRRRFWLAVALSLAGLALVVDLPGGVTLDGVGVVASLAAAVAYAAYVLMAEWWLRRGRGVFTLLAWGFGFATLFWTVVQPWWSFPAGIVDDRVSLLGRLDGIAAPVWLLFAFIVLLGTVVPFICMVTALHHVRPARATLFATIEPVIAALVAWAWLDQALTTQQIVGGLVVLAAVSIAQTARR
jgi:drug/metabolite transporter (DMT)-like permease